MTCSKAISALLVSIMLASCGTTPVSLNKESHQVHSQGQASSCDDLQDCNSDDGSGQLVRYEAYNPETIYREIRFNQRLGYALDAAKGRAMPLPVAEAGPYPNALYVNLYSVTDTNNDGLIDSVNILAASPGTRQQRIVTMKLHPRLAHDLRHYNWQQGFQAAQSFNRQLIDRMNSRLPKVQRPPYREATIDWVCVFLNFTWQGFAAAATCGYFLPNLHAYTICLIVGFGLDVYSTAMKCVK